MITPLTLSLSAEANTEQLAKTLASLLKVGDVVLLNGGLAAGKTFFVRAAVAALGLHEGVSSPTYTLVHIYQTPSIKVVHIDAYRLESPAEFADLALEDELESAVSFIEWGESLKDEFESALTLNFAALPANASARDVEITAHGKRGLELLASLAKALS